MPMTVDQEVKALDQKLIERQNRNDSYARSRSDRIRNVADLVGVAYRRSESKQEDSDVPLSL